MQDLSNYEKDVRSWGNFERFTLNEKSTVKIITVNPEQEFSLQSHKHRDEFWHIISGSGVITLDQDHRAIRAGENFFSPAGREHRMKGGPEGLVFLEISFGDFDEKDITRFEDDYGRA